MSLRSIFLAWGIIMFISTTVSADIIVPGSSRDRRSFRSWVEFTIDPLPPGVVVLCLDSRMQLIAKTDERKAFKINKPCKLYGAQKDRISAPFDPGNDMDRLVLLREIKEIDIPKGSGKPPQPLKISCGLLGEKTSRSVVMNQAREKPEKYTLHCSIP